MRRISVSRTLAAVLGLAVAGIAAPNAGAQQGAGCASCHAAESASQPVTLMAQALQLPGADPILRAHPRLTYRRGPYTYTVITQGKTSTYTVTDGVHTLSLPILWGMGAGAQTWLLSLNGKFYESLVSYFPSANQLGVTIGDENSTPRTLVEAMGRELGEQDVKSCFGCHATGAIVNDRLDLAALQPGVVCSHCHMGAEAHGAAAIKGDFNSVPPHLGALSAEDLSSFCGQCHRAWSTVVLHRWFGPMNVRFSPYRLALSKCFNGTDPRIRCVACHDPHRNVSENAASYDAKCLACHRVDPWAASVLIPSSIQRQAPACPIAKSNCVSCHMAKVKQAAGNLTFTDHFIRIVKDGAPYPH